MNESMNYIINKLNHFILQIKFVIVAKHITISKLFTSMQFTISNYNFPAGLSPPIDFFMSHHSHGAYLNPF